MDSPAPSFSPPELVGRARELTFLDDHLSRARTGAGGLVLVDAESGFGKTRLLDEFAARATKSGAWVLRAKGVPGALRPLELFQGLVTDLRAAMRQRPLLAAQLRTRLGADSDAVCAALPELAPDLGGRSAEALGPEAHGEARTIRGLSSLLDALGAKSEPAVLLFDDFHAADELAVKLIRQWQQRAREGAERYVLVVTAYRSDEVGVGNPLRSLAASQQLSLAPLGSADLRRLVESMAGALPESIHGLVHDAALGSPAAAVGVMHALLEAGALVRRDGGWEVVEGALSDLRGSLEGAELLQRRLDRLPPDVVRPLAIGAVLGMQFDPDVVSQLSGEALKTLLAINEGKARQLVWSEGTGGRCSFAHEQIRAALRERLTPEERVQIHRQAAELIERRYPDRVFDLAHHFEEARQLDRALRYALSAAELARQQSALEVAERHYRIAARANPADSNVRLQIAEGLGDVLTLRGKFDEAEEQIRNARALARGAAPQARIEGKLGELAFNKGDAKAAGEGMESALRALGRAVPGGNASAVAMLLWEALVQVLHTYFPRLFLARRRLEGAEEELIAIRLFNRLQYPYYFYKGLFATLWTHLRMLNLAERYPPSRELAQAYASHGVAMVAMPMYERAISYARRGLEIRRKVGDLWGEGVALNFLGIALFTAGQYEESLSTCEAGAEVLGRSGDLWQVENCETHSLRCLLGLGRLREATDRARRVVEGDALLISKAAALEVWSRATNGRVPEEPIRELLEAPGEDVLRVQSALQSEGLRRLSRGEALEAVAALERAEEVNRKAKQRSVYVTPVPVLLARALRAAAAQRPSEREGLLRRGLAAANRGLKLAEAFRTELAEALRERALIAAALGDVNRARKLLDRSVAVAEQLGARFQAAQSRLARGELGTERGWPDAERDVQEARALLRELGAPEPAPNIASAA